MNDITSLKGSTSVIDQYSFDARDDAAEPTDQDMFLELMLAQMENQDPLSPQDNGDFLAQLAQFSTVEGIDKLNDSMTSFEQGFRSSQALQATALVGRKVEVDGNQAYYQDGETVDGLVDVGQSSSNVKLHIYDQAGSLVLTEDYGTAATGEVPFSWDGTDSNGNKAPAGTYTIEATASQGGEAVQLATSVFANVNSVTIGSAGAVTLNVENIGSVSLEDVKKIQ